MCSALVVSPANAAPSASTAAPSSVHAILINGGDRPGANYQSHLRHLQDMMAVLRERGVPGSGVDVFSADGEDPEADLTTRDAAPEGVWLLENTDLGRRLLPAPKLVNTRWPGVTLHAAKQAALRAWFETTGRSLRPGDQLLVFVTDHGTGGGDTPDAAAISLWREKLTVRELEGLLARLAPGVRVVMVMSQCFSGAFAAAIDTAGGAPSGDVCGFFSTTGQLKAYGCYPEARDRDRLGHAYHFIDALSRRATTSDAHEDVLAEDDTPDVPLRTSDAYLARVLAAEAAARGQAEDALVDALLAQAWRAPAAWEREIRLLDRIGAAFGTFSPRTLAEVAARERELDPVAQQMGTYADRWKGALGDFETAMIDDFRRARPEWAPRITPAAVDALAPDARAALLAELLPVLLEYAHDQPEAWSKLESLRDHAARAAEAHWRLEVRQAALQRMRMLLKSVAGRVLVAQGKQDAARAAVARLQACEAWTPGTPPSSTRAAAPTSPFPPLSEDVALLEDVAPSWLGVRFHAVPPSARGARELSAGAHLLEAVYPDSPASEAGLQAGDIVVGAGGHAFEWQGEMRQWTMTSPRGVPLRLDVVRPAGEGEQDQRFEATVVLRLTPGELPKLAGPPGVGERAPALPSTLRAVGASDLAGVEGQPHLLFFWATWCGPCKSAVPEVMALAKSRGLGALAISDEDEETVSSFLAGRADPFFASVAVDPLRRSFISYGVSGTPTIVIVDVQGVIRHRQVGYTEAKGLDLDGWRWRR